MISFYNPKEIYLLLAIDVAANTKTPTHSAMETYSNFFVAEFQVQNSIFGIKEHSSKT